MKKTSLYSLLGALAILHATLHAETISLKDPTGKINYQLSTGEKGQVYQELTKGDKVLMEKGTLGQIVNGKNTGEGVSALTMEQTAKKETLEFPTRGKYPVAKVTFNEYLVQGKDSHLQLRVRVYPNGVAFRYEWPDSLTKGKDSLTVTEELTNFQFPKDVTLWTQDCPAALGPCEGIWAPGKVGSFTKSEDPRTSIRTAPVTVEYPNQGAYTLVQEAGLSGKGWSGIKFCLVDGKCQTTYYHNQQGFKVPTTTEQPWRVILVADDLNSLSNNDIIESLNPAPDKKLFPKGYDTEWVKPARSSWGWWDTCTVLQKDQKDFVDLSADFGWENYLIDDGWKKWKPTYEECLAELKSVVDYGKEKNVDIWVWSAWQDINKPDNDWAQMKEFFDTMKKIGVKGLKVDFMDSASQDRLKFYDAVLKNTAERKLMINFHGANIPTGEPRTWPHEMSREGIYGLEQNIWAEISGEHYTALPFTRMISGHGDFTGGYFGHGPKLKGSTWPLQMATNIIYTSPALHWVTNSKDMAAAFPKDSPQHKLISAIPSLWDETIVLPQAKIGEYAPFVRRHKNQWYIALINGDKGERKDEISLDFLPKGRFKMITLSDLPDKGDGWTVEEKEVTHKDKVSFTMRPRGGGVAYIVPIKK